MNNELKSCPFCKGEGYVKFDAAPYRKEYWYFIECIKCHARTGYYRDELDAIAAWNKRVTEEKRNAS